MQSDQSLIDDQSESEKSKTQALYWITGISITLLFLFVISTILMAVLYSNAKQAEGIPHYPPPNLYSVLGKFKKAAVTADNVYCSEVGRNILIKGGNAVDAAIATIICIGVMNPQSSGFGGGHFMTIYNASTKMCHVIDAREVAPLKAHKKMFIGKPLEAQIGWKAVAVPGEIHGLRTEYENFGGKVPWKSLFEPTISRLESGIPVSEALSNAIRDEWNIITQESTLRDILSPDGGKTAFKEGDVMKTRTQFAETLRLLANSNDPIREIYLNGSFTHKIVREFELNGGLIGYADFNNYRSIIRNDRDVIYTKLSGNRTICGPPPPSGSAVTQSILKIIDGYDFDQTTFDGNVDLYHKFIEASKFAYAYRSRLGDMAFVKDSLNLAQNITSNEFAEAIRAKITSQAHATEYYGGQFYSTEGDGTTHMTIMDEEGNAVSVTSTVNLYFGARVRSESTGIIWNCQMDDFSTPGHSNAYGFPPSPANFIYPGKKPQSSNSPLVVFNEENGKPLLSIGGAGGSTIISGVSTVAFRVLWLDWDLKKAVDAPRLHNQLLPNITLFEKGFPYQLLQALRSRGQSLQAVGGLSEITVTQRKDQWVFANSDHRKGTQSLGAGY